MSSDSYPRFLAQLSSEEAGARPVEYLEIRSKDDGAIKRHELKNARVLIGRGPEAELSLPTGTISRYHAEFMRDSRGLWWVQDLNSTNGTFVNGKPVTSQLLNYGDAVGVGDFLLVLRADNGTPAPIRPTYTPGLGRPTPNLVPRVGVNVDHSMATAGFVANLQHIALPERRRHLLCEYASSKSFASSFSWVVELTSEGKARLLAGRYPESATRNAQPESDVLSNQSEAVAILAWCESHHSEFWELKGAEVIQGGREQVLACPLARFDDRIEVFCIRLTTTRDTERWLQLVAFLVDGAQRSDELWQLRDDIRRTAKLEYELSLATQIQRSLIPTETRFKGLEVSLSFQPSRSVGGDYVDIVQLRDGRTLLVVADVCGKGLQAALITISLHTLIHVLVDFSDSLQAVATSVNQHLHRYLPDHSFVTMIFLALHPYTGKLECINAGHPPALLLNVDGTVAELQGNQNVPLGMLPEFQPKVEHYLLERDEVLFMYTDGLSEAQSPEGKMLGTENLRAHCARLVRDSKEGDLDVLKARLESTVATFQSGAIASDDRAFLFARLVNPLRSGRVHTTIRPPAVKQ